MDDATNGRLPRKSGRSCQKPGDGRESHLRQASRQTSIIDFTFASVVTDDCEAFTTKLSCRGSQEPCSSIAPSATHSRKVAPAHSSRQARTRHFRRNAKYFCRTCLGWPHSITESRRPTGDCTQAGCPWHPAGGAAGMTNQSVFVTILKSYPSPAPPGNRVRVAVLISFPVRPPEIRHAAGRYDLACCWCS